MSEKGQPQMFSKNWEWTTWQILEVLKPAVCSIFVKLTSNKSQMLINIIMSVVITLQILVTTIIIIIIIILVIIVIIISALDCRWQPGVFLLSDHLCKPLSKMHQALTVILLLAFYKNNCAGKNKKYQRIQDLQDFFLLAAQRVELYAVAKYGWQ